MKNILNKKGEVITFNAENAIIMIANYNLANVSGIYCCETSRPIIWGSEFIYEKVDGGARVFSKWSQTWKRFSTQLSIDKESRISHDLEIKSGLYDN